MSPLVTVALLSFGAAALCLYLRRDVPPEETYETAESGPMRKRSALLQVALILIAGGVYLLWLAAA